MLKLSSCDVPIYQVSSCSYQFAFFCSFSILHFSKDGTGSCLVVVHKVNGSSARISADRNALFSPIEFSSAEIEIGF